MRKRIVTFLSLAILCFITVGSFAETALRSLPQRSFKVYQMVDFSMKTAGVHSGCAIDVNDLVALDITSC